MATSLSSVNGLRVLVAEDDGMIAEAICNRLTDMGCEVVATADTGAGAVEAALSTRPDVVLMDVRLKGDMDGIRASELINEKMRVPVVYLTGDSDQKTLARAKAASAYGYVLKPFHIRNIIVAIEVAIDRFEMERRLEESQLSYATILGSIAEAVIAVDLQGRVRFMNGVAERLTGWRNSLAQREPIGSVLLLSDAKGAWLESSPMERVLTERMSFPLGEETWVTSRDAVRVQVDGSMACIVDSLDRVVGASITLRDVTSERRAALQLKAKAQQLRAVIDTAVNGVLMLDAVGTILIYNRACKQLFGYASDEIVGRNIAMIMPAALQALPAGAQLGEPSADPPPMVGAARPMTCRRRDGSTFPAEVTTGEASDSDQPLFVCVVHDVSERRRLEAAVLDAVGQEQRRFASDLHDGLGQELTGLAFLLSALATEARNQGSAQASELERAYDVANRAMQSSQAIARGLSPIGAAEGGLIRALGDLVARLQGPSGPALEFSVAQGAPLHLVPAAADHLYRIAQEALSNALKHSQAAAIKVTLDIEADHVRLEIRDDGRGVRSPDANPAGLGLRTMQYRASMIGARCGISSIKPHGTRVSCECPQPS
jgi:PAS domain S-box-containing protein